MSVDFRAYVNEVADFPKRGVRFFDIAPLFDVPDAFTAAITRFSEFAEAIGATRIAAIEAKGFVLGAALAYRLSVPLQLIRKPGLIPGAVEQCPFTKEYGSASYECARRPLPASERVLIVYDILAGAGASGAAATLLRATGATPVGYAFVTELAWLGGREALQPLPVCALVQIEPSDQTELLCA